MDDDTNYTVFALTLIEKYGRNFKPNDVLEGWLQLIPYLSTCTAERVAYRNAAAGITSPETAIIHNPYREWIGAQIRGDFFGYINPGNPTLAAEYAFRDASISHIKNGIYGEMFISALIAAAAVVNDMMIAIEIALDEVPIKSRFRKDIELVIEWYKSNMSAEEIIDKIHSVFDEHSQHDWCHTNSNAMIVVMALLCGNKDFGKSICLSVQAAFDTDCNGATVGSVIGIMVGEKAIPDEWISVHNNKLYTSIADNQLVTVEELSKRTLKLLI